MAQAHHTTIPCTSLVSFSGQEYSKRVIVDSIILQLRVSGSAICGFNLKAPKQTLLEHHRHPSPHLLPMIFICYNYNKNATNYVQLLGCFHHIGHD